MDRRMGAPTMKTILFLVSFAMVVLSGSQNGSAQNPPALSRPASPVDGKAWTNGLGMKFTPAGTPGVLFSVWDVRVKDYAAFVEANPGHDAGTDWKNPGWAQTPECPVVNVDWNDARAFCQWLTKKEQAEGILTAHQQYRLPTDAEWSKAAGLNESSDGTPKDKDGKFKGVYPWGTEWPPPQGAGNYAETLTRDGFLHTSPVGSFAANQYGLYDMGGNVWQWCEDNYDTGDDHRVLRGASWETLRPDVLESASRYLKRPTMRRDCIGFRVVLDVTP